MNTIELLKAKADFPKTIIINDTNSARSIVVLNTDLDIDVSAAFAYSHDGINTIPLVDSAGDAVTMSITAADRKAGLQMKDLFAENLHITFSVAESRPQISAEANTNIMATTADVSGSVDPNSSDTDVEFQYGLTTDYELGSIVANESPIGTGTVGVAVHASLADLLPETEYHWRIKANNSVGTTNGTDQTFTTAAA